VLMRQYLRHVFDSFDLLWQNFRNYHFYYLHLDESWPMLFLLSIEEGRSSLTVDILMVLVSSGIVIRISMLTTKTRSISSNGPFAIVLVSPAIVVDKSSSSTGRFELSRKVSRLMVLVLPAIAMEKSRSSIDRLALSRRASKLIVLVSTAIVVHKRRSST
jgi:hypothetical protein